jgi:hypothetical protein
VHEKLLGSQFLTAICRTAKKRPRKSISSAREANKAFRLFCEYLDRNSRSSLLKQINNGPSKAGGFGSVMQWQLTLAGFRQYINSIEVEASTKNKYISGTNYWLNNLQGLGHIPRFKLLRSFNVIKRVSQSLLDYTYSDESLKRLGIDTSDKSEIDKMLESIELDLGKLDYKDLPGQAASVLKSRLIKVRNHAEFQFIEADKHRKKSLVLIRKYRKHLPLINAWLEWRKSKSTGARNPYNPKVKELNDEAWWGSHLAWCWYMNEGLEPKEKTLESRNYVRIRREFLRRKDKRGDMAIANAIGCTVSLFAPAMMLLIHDLCANVGSVRKIKWDADYSDDFGVEGVDWKKLRSHGILTAIDNINGHVTPTKVVRIIRMSTRHYRKAALRKDKHNLFLHHHSTKPNRKDKKSEHVLPLTPSATIVGKALKDIIGKAAKNRWTGTGKSIRISLLLYKGINEGLIAVQEAAQHKNLRTSQQYSDKAPMLMKHNNKMREFKEWLQALVTVSLDDVASKLGIPDEQYELRKQEVLSSRFGGIYCKNALEGVQLGTIKGELCRKISKCLTCSNRRNIFVASEDNIMHLLHWNEALVKAKKLGQIIIEESEDWLFWGIFIDSMLTRLSRGGARYKAILAGAKELASERENNYLKINFKAFV